MNNVLGIGIDGLNWIDSLKKLQDLSIALMKLHPHTSSFLSKGLKSNVGYPIEFLPIDFLAFLSSLQGIIRSILFLIIPDLSLFQIG
jgi:hypothetical protein